MKAYVKPELFYERYELSQYIANCDIKLINSTNAQSCAGVADPSFNYGNGTLFLNNETCTTILDIYCETNGGDGFLTTFMS